MNAQPQLPPETVEQPMQVGWQAETRVGTELIQTIMPERHEIQGSVDDAIVELNFVAGFTMPGVGTIPVHSYRMGSNLKTMERVLQDALDGIRALKRAGDLTIARSGAQAEAVASKARATGQLRG